MDFNALTLSHRILEERIRPGDTCIDATAGRGRDTAFLCRLTGTAGKVHAFDIQAQAIESTRRLLEEEGLASMAELHLEGHENMGRYAAPGSVGAIAFNLGWLPGGDHGIFTRRDTTIAAIEAGLPLLRPGGVMSICIYYGRDCGFEERDALLRYFPKVDSKAFTVVVADFVNRPNNPPIPVFLYREE